MKRFILLLLITCVMSCGCTPQDKMHTEYSKVDHSSVEWKDLIIEHSMELQFANQFGVDYYEGGYALISIKNGGSFLVIPENKQVPVNIPTDFTVLKKPISNIYLVSTAAMDPICVIGGLQSIRFTGTKASDWYVDEAREALQKGELIYAGKYNAPDYERILSGECGLAIQNTMILHNPEVKEQLEQLGIPVMIERSSYESHPLGRLEWMKLYSVLLGKEDEAFAYFDEKIGQVQAVIEERKNTDESNQKTVAFFYITSDGAVNVRKSKDYVPKMIELAGGRYIFDKLAGEDENALSTMKLQMEAFYAQARDADYLIYNSTIDGEIENLEALIAKSELLKDFKAVKNGNVWCTQKSMFQESTGIADMIVDLRQILTNQGGDKLTYIYRLK